MTVKITIWRTEQKEKGEERKERERKGWGNKKRKRILCEGNCVHFVDNFKQSHELKKKYRDFIWYQLCLGIIRLAVIFKTTQIFHIPFFG